GCNPLTPCIFFSSSRRHTRFSRDWSSDVCSSDLLIWLAAGMFFALRARIPLWGWVGGIGCGVMVAAAWWYNFALSQITFEPTAEIGSASCRERLWVSGNHRNPRNDIRTRGNVKH